MSVEPNPFIDPDDGRVLADDGEKEREQGWAHQPETKAPKRKKAVKDERT